MSKFSKIIIFLVLVILVIGSVSLYIGNEKFRNIIDVNILKKESFADNNKSIYTSASTTTAVMNIGRNIGVLKNGELSIYDKEAKLKNTIKMVLGAPIYHTEERYAVITDKSGTTVYLIDEDKVKWEKSLDVPIERVHVNRNGYVTVITKNSIYKGVVHVYSNTGELLIKSYVSSGTVIDAELSNDNKFLAIADINYSKVTIESNIKVINVSKGKEKPEEAVVNEFKKDKLLINIKFKDTGELIAQYIDSIYNIGMVKDKNTEILKIDKKISNVDIEGSNNIVLVEKENSGIFKNKYKVKILTPLAKEKAEYNLNENEPKNIKVQADAISVNTGSELVIINSNGWVKRKYKTNKEIQKYNFNDFILNIINIDKIEIIEM